MKTLTPEQIKKLKTCGLAFAIALVVLLGSFSVYLMIKNKHTLKELTFERDRYGLLAAEKHKLDSIEVVRLGMVKERDKIIEELQTKYRWRMAEVKNLKDSLAIKNAKIDSLSADSSFMYINFVYPAISERRFPLDSVQIKTFHRLDINYKGEVEFNNSLSLAMNDLKRLNDNCYLQTENYKTLYLNRKDFAEVVSKDNDVLKTQVKTLNKQVNKQRLFKTLSGSALIGTVGYIVVTSLIK
jgi:hypothetical protein